MQSGHQNRIHPGPQQSQAKGDPGRGTGRGEEGGCLGLGSRLQPQAIPKESALVFPDRNAELDFSTFLNIMYRQMKQEEPEREILTALSMIDRQKRGVITASELRAKLTRLGEKLSEEEGIL